MIHTLAQWGQWWFPGWLPTRWNCAPGTHTRHTIAIYCDSNLYTIQLQNKVWYGHPHASYNCNILPYIAIAIQACTRRKSMWYAHTRNTIAIYCCTFIVYPPSAIVCKSWYAHTRHRIAICCDSNMYCIRYKSLSQIVTYPHTPKSWNSLLYICTSNMIFWVLHLCTTSCYLNMCVTLNQAATHL